MEKIVFEGTKEQIENLKKLVSDTKDMISFPKMRDDYQTYNLWCVEDVQHNYDCTDEQALEVLEQALTNDATMEQIWFAIHHHAENLGLKKYDEEEY